VFDQQNLVCTNWFEVDCQQSLVFFGQEIGLKEPTKIVQEEQRQTDHSNSIEGEFNTVRISHIFVSQFENS